MILTSLRFQVYILRVAGAKKPHDSMLESRRRSRRFVFLSSGGGGRRITFGLGEGAKETAEWHEEEGLLR
jgi:hypothetical protein